MENNKYILTLGSYNEVHLKVTIENTEEPAYEAQLFILHPQSLNYIASSDEDKQILCNPHNESMVVCGLGNPFKSQSKITLRFDPKSINDALTEFTFIAFANSTSVQLIKHEPQQIIVTILKQAEVSIKGSAVRTNVIYGGEVKENLKYSDEIGSNITHLYQVVNNGPWKVTQLNVEVAWPVQVSSSKGGDNWLLYLEKVPVVEAAFSGGGECYVRNDQINPLNLTSKPGLDVPMNLKMPNYPDFMDKHYQHSKNRLRRDVSEGKKNEIIDQDGFPRQVVTMVSSFFPLKFGSKLIF